MSWTAIVPIKPPIEGKTRLSDILEIDDRSRLGRVLLDHVSRVLSDVAEIGDIVLLCREPPRGWTGSWAADAGRGLNAELQTAALVISSNLLVIHADLPMLRAADVTALVQAADGGAAIAPDRHLSGTNALAFADPKRARFAFGQDSFAKHRASAPFATIVHRTGLAQDLDTPEDFMMLLVADGLDPIMQEALGPFRARSATT
jgi:2-phospho-L-lactate guanylyltransferase